jgi:hypothetical protein
MEKHVYLSLLAISLFIIGVLYTNEGKLYNHIDNDAVADLAGGDYIRFVYIGSSTCPFSNNADTHNKIRFLKNNLEDITMLTDTKFISTGISVDSHPHIGYNYLEETKPYNEIIVGTSVFNLGSIFYASGVPTTPRILIIKESYESELVGINLNHLEKSQSLFRLYSGIHEIDEFHDFLSTSSIEEVIKEFDL